MNETWEGECITDDVGKYGILTLCKLLNFTWKTTINTVRPAPLTITLLGWVGKDHVRGQEEMEIKTHERNTFNRAY